MEETAEKQNNTSSAKKPRAKKILTIVGNVLIYLFFAICVFLLIYTMFSKRDSDGAVKMFGHEIRIVTTGSMEKNEQTDVSKFAIKDIPKTSAIFIELVPESDEAAEAWYADLKVGDVLTFQYVVATSREVITHRVVSIEEKETGGYVITLKGDNGSGSSDTWGTQIIDTSQEASLNYVIGKVVWNSFVIGVVVNAVRQPIGIALIVIVPCAIIIILQVIKIVNVLNASKQKKAEEQAERQLSEMEELKRKIAELESKSSPAPSEVPMSATAPPQTCAEEEPSAPSGEDAQDISNS